ncbi:olfactory receptor 11L1-like [Engystomops pustulosus]|uniref:olfactory receptor 11L1-like n=1 Tax=Engystomops pustulosus TaxID=76066 RepID=UPI003AFAC739
MDQQDTGKTGGRDTGLMGVKGLRKEKRETNSRNHQWRGGCVNDSRGPDEAAFTPLGVQHELCSMMLSDHFSIDHEKCGTFRESCLLYFKVQFQSNTSEISSVILLGFTNIGSFRWILFTLLLVIYFGTICGNLLIIILVSTSQNLHSPMYFFLTHLSISDIMLITDIAPYALYGLLVEVGIMCFRCCFAQYFFFGVPLCFECLLLAVMSFDRYLAICNPLRYMSIMTMVFCRNVACVSWILSLIAVWLEIMTLSKLDFCGPNVIDHFLCDMSPLLQLSCSDTSMVELEITLLCIPVLILPFFFIISTYICIISSILRIKSVTRRQKAFSTCSSHLTVVSIFYGTLSSTYVLPARGETMQLSKALSLLYTVGTPLLNPIIYSLRNKDIKQAFTKFIKKLSLSTAD